jgi:sulfate adenylyltransferase
MTQRTHTGTDEATGDARPVPAREASVGWASIDLTAAQVADVELLTTGAYAPLSRFMTREEAEAAGAGSTRPGGSSWPAPIVLAVSEPVAAARREGEAVALREPEGVRVAALTVQGTWQDAGGAWCVAGTVEGIDRPPHYDFHRLWRTPADIGAEIAARRWTAALAYWPGPLVHAAQRAALEQTAAAHGAGIVLLAGVEPDAPLELAHYARVGGLEASIAGAPALLLSLVPAPRADAAAGRWGLRAVVARAAGCRGLVVDVDQVRADGLSVEDVRGLVVEQGLDLVVLPGLAYDPATGRAVDAAAPGAIAVPPMRDLVAAVRAGHAPAGLLPAAAVRALELAYPPRQRQGFTLFFTGLSGSGKSTIANAVRVRLLEHTGRPVTFLDGDLVRKHLSSELGFSREHRDLNILRIGYVASEITRHGGIAICAPIAPYDAIRQRVRAMVAPAGGFVLVHVATPLAVCEARDRKGLYAKARAGLIPQFTGVSDPYEEPADAALTIHTEVTPVERAAGLVIGHLEREGYLAPAGTHS